MKGIVLTAMDDEIYEVLSDNEIFADLFNGALFGGNQIIRPDMLEQENEKKVMRVGKEGGRRVILRRIRDVQKLSGLRESCLAVVLAAEGQRNVHYAMPVRCMLYDAMLYKAGRAYGKKEKRGGKAGKGSRVSIRNEEGRQAAAGDHDCILLWGGTELGWAAVSS